MHVKHQSHIILVSWLIERKRYRLNCSRYQGIRQMSVLVFCILILTLPISYDIALQKTQKRYLEWMLPFHLAALCLTFISGPAKELVINGFSNESSFWGSFSTLVIAFDGMMLPFVCHQFKKSISEDKKAGALRILYYVCAELLAIAVLNIF